MKKIIATLLTATLVVANCVPALAAGVDGQGAVEYDNSVEITYDKIQVPVLTPAKYNFTLDPTDNLATYNSAEYTETNSGVYFKSQKTAAKIEQQASDDANYKDLYTLSKAAVAADAADWKEVVTAVTEDEAKTPTVTGGYYVWTPADFTAQELHEGTTATGQKGDYTELTPSNIKTYFNISEADNDGKFTITAKADHLATETCVFDGKLYKATYTAMSAAISDNPPTNDFDEYVELNADGKTIKTVKGVYVAKDGGGYELATVANIKFTPAEIKYQAVTDKVVVTNKSTKKKTVKAVVTMSNVDGLLFKTEDGDDIFTGDKTASVLFKATDGTAANDAILTKGETTATATYELDVDGATVTPIKYQGGLNPKTGGHNYFNYEAVGTHYYSNSFWLTAKANTNSDDDTLAAWKAYGKAVEDAYANETSAAPKINIVYTVTDFQDSYAVTFKPNYDGATVADQTESGITTNPTGTAAKAAFEEARSGWTVTGWATSASGEAVDLSTITAATTLYAKWSQNTFAITKKFNDGSTADAVVDVASGETFAKPADPTWTGHTFKGWYDAATGGNEIEFPLSSATTIHAQWYTNHTAVVTPVDGTFWISSTASDGFGNVTVNKVTLNGKELSSSEYSITDGQGGKWVGVTWTTVEAKGEGEATSWTFTVDINNDRYIGTYQ